MLAGQDVAAPRLRFAASNKSAAFETTTDPVRPSNMLVLTLNQLLARGGLDVNNVRLVRHKLGHDHHRAVFEVAPVPWTVQGFRSRGVRVRPFVLDG